MKSSLLELELTTTPSTFVRTGSERYPVPYRRLIAVSGPAGMVACKNRITTPTSAEIIRATPAFASHLQDFAGKWLTARDPEDGGGTATDAAYYQCHFFALSAQSRKVKNAAQAAQWALEQSGEAKNIHEVEVPLPFGTHVVIRGGRKGNVLHSSLAVGLAPDGEQNSLDPTDQIQALQMGGNIGIAPLRDSVQYYKELGYEPVVSVVPQGIVTRTLARLHL